VGARQGTRVFWSMAPRGRHHRKTGEDEDDGLSPEKLEFADRWVYYPLLLLRVQDSKLMTNLKTELFYFAVFCFIFYLHLIQDSMVTTQFHQHELFDDLFVSKPFIASSEQTPDGTIHTAYSDFNGIRNKAMLDDWLDQVLFPTLFESSSQTVEGYSQNFSFAHGNQILWGVQLRQLRVKSSHALWDSGVCKVPPGVSKDDRLCHPSYGEFGRYVKDTAPYGMHTAEGGRQYTYATVDHLNGSVIFSYDLDMPMDLSSYDGDGYEVLLPLNRTKARRVLDEAQGRLPCLGCHGPNGTVANPVPFLDTRSRLLVVTLQTYNVNTNMFANFELLVQFTGAGSTLTFSRFKTASLVLLPITSSLLPNTYVVVSFLSIVITVWVVGSIIQFLTSVRDYGLDELTAWSFFELGCNIIFLLLEIDHAIDQAFPVSQQNVRYHLRDREGYYSLQEMLHTKAHYERLKALLCVLAIMRAFKFLGVVNALDVMGGTIKQQMKYIQGFIMGELTMLFGYSMAAHLIFGPDDEQFSQIPLSLGTLVYSTISGFSPREKPTAQETVFSIVFVFFQCHMFLFVIVAIIVTGWKRKVEEKERAEREGKALIKIDPLTEFLNATEDIRESGHFFLYIRHLVYEKVVRVCCTCRGICDTLKWLFCSWRKGGRDMSIDEVLRRLERWKKRPENQDTLFVNFDLLKVAMVGDMRIKRVVDDHEVGHVLSLCYEDIRQRSGYRFLLDTDQMMQADKFYRLNEPVENVVTPPAVEHSTLMKKSWKAFQIMHDDMMVQENDVYTLLEELHQNELLMFNRVTSLAARSREVAPVE
jgi:hypothetical protein